MSAGGGKLPQVTTRPWPTSVADKAVGARPRKTLGRARRRGLATAIPAFGSAARPLGLGPATKLGLRSVPVGRSCRAVRRQLPPQGDTAAAPRGSIPDSGKEADSAPQQDEGCRASDVLCGNNSVTIKTYWPYVHSSFFFSLLLHESKIRGPRQV